MMNQIEGITGLTPDQVTTARHKYGWNKLDIKQSHPFIQSLMSTLREPMLVLLILASTIYFITGTYAEGIFMVSAVVVISFISLYQESRSKTALEALKAYSQPKAKVIRGGVTTPIPTEEIVPEDYFIVEEGEIIPADGTIVQSNDFSVSESILTGESLPISKSSSSNDSVYQGTLVASGLAICKTTAIGIQTRVGQIGKSLQEIRPTKSPLQNQIEDFVRKMAMAGSIIFVVIWAINYFKTYSVLDSLLKALTLAMSILPEEIPVAFTTFMALGAWRLVQLGVIVKQTKTVETLGSATVICVDKTGTLTKNEMALAAVYDFSSDKIYEPNDFDKVKPIISAAMWASEPIPFDPMEKALHKAYAETTAMDERSTRKIIREYPLSGAPPIMTHVWEHQGGGRIIAAKGAPEAFLKLCRLTLTQQNAVGKAVHSMAGLGLRVLGVADVQNLIGAMPAKQEEFKFVFKGLVGFYDPPKENITTVLEGFYKAGIEVKLITGDHTVTAQTIAKQIHFKDGENFVTGDELMAMSGDEVQDTVRKVNMFTRMFPEAKLQVVQALKQNSHIVAMTGDGVNDAPALKAAHIGIAMGSKGSEVAKQASALVLSKDDLSGMVQAIAMGRKIYSNLKKAIQYIISIHIPAIFIVFLPLVLGWPFPAVFTPVHIIFLELIMGPTCSIIYENEPIEANVMAEKPRRFTKTFFSLKELTVSVIQGLWITAGLVFIYWHAVGKSDELPKITSMIFVTLITANILLTLTNRSFHYSMFTTLKYKNNLMPLIISITTAVVILIFWSTTMREFFKFQLLTAKELVTCILTGAISVLWFEGFKLIKRMAIRSNKSE